MTVCRIMNLSNSKSTTIISLLLAIATLAMLQSSAGTLASSFTPSSGITSRKGNQIANLRSPFLVQTRGGASSDEESGSNDNSYAPQDNNSGDFEAQQQQQQPITDDSSPSVPAPSQSTNTPSLLGSNAPPPGWLRKSLPGLPYHRFPDYLTYLRCLAIPCLCGLFYWPGQHLATGVLFALASFTDWLDGFLARRWDVSTAFGAFLDPVADKLMVATALILLSGRYGAIVVIPASIILARELAVSALREWMAQKGLRDVVKVGYQGKVKTALTMVSLTLLLLVPDSGEGGVLVKLLLPGLASLYLASIITITSGSVYFRAAAPVLLEK